MGALLTSLLRKSSLFLENIVRFLAQLRAIKFVRSKISWPPSAAGVRRNAPYLFLGVYLPKLIFDIWTITRRVPIDEELLRESEAELTACVAKSGQVLNAFLAADIPVPKSSPLFDSKLKIFNCIRLLLQKYGMHKPHKASLRLKNKCVVKNKSVTKSPIAGSQQLNAGQQQPSLPQDNENIILPLLNDVHESNLPETDAYAEDLEDIKSQDSCDDGKNDIDLFRLDEALIKAISEGNFTDEFDEMHERLTAIASNVDVIKDKLQTPPPTHRLHGQVEQLETMITLIHHWVIALKQCLVIAKTNSSQVKKWDGGQCLEEFNDETYLVSYWHATVPPREFRNRTGRKICYDHKKGWRQASTQEKHFWKAQEEEVKCAACDMLIICEDNLREREDTLAKLRKSKTGKIIHAVRLIIGSPTNWAMVGATWIFDLLEGMINGAIMYYRSELLIAAQNAANQTVNSSDSILKSSTKSLMELVSAIVLTELAKVVIADLKEKVDDMGVSAIQRRLQMLLGERLLAQDLEVHDENEKANEFGWGLAPSQLFRSFPIQNFIEMPATILRVTSTVLSTAYLLWSKNSYLFVVIACALLAKRFVLEHSSEFKNMIWYNYLDTNCPISNSRRRAIDIFQALHNFYDVRVNGCEFSHLKQLHRKDEAETVSKQRRQAFNSMFQSIRSVVREFPTIVSYVVGCNLIVKGTLAPSDLVMFPTSIQDIIDDVEELYDTYENAFDYEDLEMKQLDAIVELLNEKPKIGICGGFVPESGELEDSSIEFQDVTFRRSAWPIRQAGLSFKVPAGSFVAICGKNGVGKSTLFKLLLRLYDVDEGSIEIGGRNIKEYNPVWLRSKAVAIAPQKPGLYWGTLRSNLIYGSEDRLTSQFLNDDEIDKLLEKVLLRSGTLHMFRDPRSFAQGFDTRKDPSKMSGGQQRAVGLARALFRDAKILCLDEPTNDLDPDRQQAVKTSLIKNRPKGQTILCVTHELSTIQDADLIIFIDKDASGVTSIHGTGRYEQLIQSCDTFRRWHEFKWPNNGHKQDEKVCTVPERKTVKASSKPVLLPLMLDDNAVPVHSALVSAPPLQRSLTWSRDSSNDAIDPAQPASPGTIRKQLLQRHTQKMSLKRFKSQMDAVGEDKEKQEMDYTNRTRGWLGFRSSADFHNAQQCVDEMTGAAVEKLLPQYEALVKQMRIRVYEQMRGRQSMPWSRLMKRHNPPSGTRRSLTSIPNY